MLLLLTAVAAGCTALKLTVVVGVHPASSACSAAISSFCARPRSRMLSKRAGGRPWICGCRLPAERAYAAAMEREEQPSAQIIDISARVGDQLYDQYADATVRAVGD